VVLAVAEITTLDEVLELASTESASGVGQLEWPEEIVHLLEVGADSVDLMDDIFHAHHAVLAQLLLDDGVVRQRDALLVAILHVRSFAMHHHNILRNLHLAISALVDQLTDRLQVGVTVGNVGFHNAKHLNGCLCEADEDAVVDLKKAEELESLALLGVDLVDTLDTDDKGKLGLRWHVEGSLRLGDTSKADTLALRIAVFLDILLGALEDGLSLLLVRLGNFQVSKRTRLILLFDCLLNTAFQTRKMILFAASWVRRPSQRFGYISHHHDNNARTWASSLTSRFFRVSWARSSRSFSCDLRFLRTVSGIRTSFLVGTLLLPKLNVRIVED
jgi:hypothetical protein